MNNLLALNVNNHIEKKNGLSYISWAWAWAEVLKADPNATWETHEYSGLPFMRLPDESCMVKVTVTIKGTARACLLPVMDHRNKAIKNPDAFSVNTAIMRCMTKAISMHGLGLYIYAGEDLPQVDREPTAEELAQQARQKELEAFAAELVSLHEHGKDLTAIEAWYSPTAWSDDAGTRAEEQKFVWEQLKPWSKLRSAIKANKPE